MPIYYYLRRSTAGVAHEAAVPLMPSYARRFAALPFYAVIAYAPIRKCRSHAILFTFVPRVAPAFRFVGAAALKEIRFKARYHVRRRSPHMDDACCLR